MRSHRAIRVSFTVLAALLVCAGSRKVLQAQDLNAPSELTAHSGAPGDLAISLFWIDNAVGEQGFEIQRSTGTGAFDFETIDVVLLSNIGSYNDVGLSEDTTYNYRVRAFNATMLSDFSDVATAATGFARPSQVASLQGERQGDLVLLTWVDASDNETRFEVERAEVGVSTEFITLAVLAPDTTTYVDASALNGTAYDYRVRPWRFDVAGGAPAVVTITMGPGIAPLRSVRDHAKSKTAIELSWKGNFDDGTSVQIQRFQPELGLWFTTGQVRAAERKFTDRGLASQTTYSFRLRAITATAVSPWEFAFGTTK